MSRAISSGMDMWSAASSDDYYGFEEREEADEPTEDTVVKQHRNGNDELWQRANTAIAFGQWDIARSALDVLLAQYVGAGVDMFPLPAKAPDFIRDRITLWNHKVAS